MRNSRTLMALLAALGLFIAILAASCGDDDDDDGDTIVVPDDDGGSDDDSTADDDSQDDDMGDDDADDDDEMDDDEDDDDADDDTTEPSWVDDFESDGIDESKWETGSQEEGADGGLWDASFSQSGGRLDARIWGPTSGTTYGQTAWVMTTYDFNDGSEHVVNFEWGADVNASHIDYYAIQLTNGATDTSGDFEWFKFDTSDWVNLYFQSGQPDLAQTARSIVIDPDGGEATLWSGSGGTGSELETKALGALGEWHIRFIFTDATSSGFPEGDNHLYLYSVSSGS